MLSRFFVSKAAVCMLALLAAPLFVFAAFETFPSVKAPRLILTVDGKTGTVPVTSGKTVSVEWSWTGKSCASNWNNGILPASGQESGTISEPRLFAIACFGGNGVSTAKVTVTVARPDLTVKTFQVTGLTKNTKYTNPTYFPGAAAYTLEGVVANLGTGDANGSIPVVFQYSTDRGKNWALLESKSIQTLIAKESETVRIPRPASDSASATYFFRVCIDPASAEKPTGDVLESAPNDTNNSKDKNNCSKGLGPYTFAN